MCDHARLLLIAVLLGVLPLSAACMGAEAKPALKCGAGSPKPTAAASPFKADPSGLSFEFQTERIEGTIRTDGAYHGVSRLVDKQSGRQVIDPRYSALNLFKLMSVNQVMGQPRTMERKVALVGRAVEIHWPPDEAHRADLTARYEIASPDAVDLTVIVRPQGVYPGYELFLSSYFDKTFRPHVWLKSRGVQASERVLPMLNDVFRGTVVVFPRDSHAARPCLDGRWDRDERKTPTVQMCPVRHYAHCLAVQADPQDKLAVVLMSRPACCYAISTRYHADKEADRLTTYSAFDLSLFGADTVPGVELRAKVRLKLMALDGDWSRPVEAYQAWMKEI